MLLMLKKTFFFSVLQSSVALIRTRPIIDIKTSIRPSNSIINIDPTIQGCERDPGANYTCFHFQACCIIQSLVKSTQTNVHNLNYVIEAETFPGGRKYSRVFFDNDKSNVVNKTIRLGKDVEDCREHIVYLKNNTRDIQTPIKVSDCTEVSDASYFSGQIKYPSDRKNLTQLINRKTNFHKNKITYQHSV